MHQNGQKWESRQKELKEKLSNSRNSAASLEIISKVPFQNIGTGKNRENVVTGIASQHIQGKYHVLFTETKRNFLGLWSPVACRRPGCSPTFYPRGLCSASCFKLWKMWSPTQKQNHNMTTNLFLSKQIYYYL